MKNSDICRIILAFLLVLSFVLSISYISLSSRADEMEIKVDSMQTDLNDFFE